MVTSRPYDVISDDRRARYLERSAYNVVHVDLADGVNDPSSPGNRYERAAELLRGWEHGGILRRTPPIYAAYEMAFRLEGRARTLRGVMVAMELEPWGGAIVPHEHVMSGPVEDRLRLLRETGTHLSAIYGTVSGPVPALGGLLDALAATSPDGEVQDEEGVRHRIWWVDPTVPLDRWLGSERLLIADGHHRYTTALAYREERGAAVGTGPWDRVLTLIVDAGTQEVPVLPYHRLQRTGSPLEGGEPVPDLATLRRALDDRRGRVGAIVAGKDTRYRLHTLDGGAPAVSRLQHDVLDRLAPEDVFTFTHDADEADAAVARGDAVAAYLLPPTTPEAIMGVVERGERLPRKSTFFWPKPRTGMVMMPLLAAETSPTSRSAPPAS